MANTDGLVDMTAIAIGCVVQGMPEVKCGLEPNIVIVISVAGIAGTLIYIK